MLEDHLERLFSSDLLFFEDAVAITRILYDQIDAEHLCSFVNRLKPCLRQILEDDYSEISAEEYDVDINGIITSLRDGFAPDEYIVDVTDVEQVVDDEVSACAHQELSKLLLTLPGDFSDLIPFAETMHIFVTDSSSLASTYLEPDISDWIEYSPSESVSVENEIDYLFMR